MTGSARRCTRAANEPARPAVRRRAPSQTVSRRELGLRARYRARVGGAGAWPLGLDGFSTARVRRTGSLAIPAREGDLIVFGQPPGNDVNADQLVGDGGRIAPYVERDVHTRRVERDAEPARRRLPRRWQPRAAADRRHAARRLRAPRLGDSIRALSVAYASSPAADRDGRRRPLPPAGRCGRSERGVRLARARTGPRGARDAVAAGRSWPATPPSRDALFYRRLDGLAVRSPLATPVLAAALVSDGRGRSDGSI